MRVLFLLVFALTFSQVSKVSSQSVEQALSQAVGEMKKANSRFESEIKDTSELYSRLSGLLSFSGCDCDIDKGSCSADVKLVPGEARSELIITVSVARPYCARVGTFITTQWDIDNNTPAYESFNYLREPQHSEWVHNADWNGRQPVLLDDVSCKLCATGDSQFCEESNGLAEKYGPLALTNAQAAKQMEEPVAQMKATATESWVELADLTAYQMGLIYQTADLYQKLADMVQTQRQSRCH
ncbi:hypothetical protein [Ruegeria sp. SCP11]|uniref:hypothetical protein n=1 Tax=Ruegeria sp. SCP11 TaxID=3141378 RepID=UPI003337821D